MNLKHLSDSELLLSTEDAVKGERRSMTLVLYHLLEVEERRLFSPYPSLHEYCVKKFKYSAPAAQRRIDAMRVLRVVPEVNEKIQSGSLNLTTLSQAQTFFRQEKKVEKALAPEAKREVLAALESKSTREVERELVGRATEPLKLKKKDRVRAVSKDLSELKCLVSDEALQDLERVRGLLGHKHPNLSMGELLALLAKMALENLDPAKEPKRRRTAKPAPEVKEGTPEPKRYISAQTRREVWKKALGKCSNCGGLYRLQIDHILPFALGGSNQIENLRLLCFQCNQREADHKLGRAKMETHRNPAPFKDTGSPSPSRSRPR